MGPHTAPFHLNIMSDKLPAILGLNCWWIYIYLFIYVFVSPNQLCISINGSWSRQFVGVCQSREINQAISLDIKARQLICFESSPFPSLSSLLTSLADSWPVLRGGCHCWDCPCTYMGKLALGWCCNYICGEVQSRGAGVDYYLLCN